MAHASRVAAVIGTHTHIPTADLRVLADGTVYASDVEMTGEREHYSVQPRRVYEGLSWRRRRLYRTCQGLWRVDGVPIEIQRERVGER